MYTSFKDLNKAYGFDNPLQSREHLTKEREKAYVNDCFDTYEHIGFAETFYSPYDEFKAYNEKRFLVLGRVDATKADLECLPMWNIRFEDETEICAYPEEICKAERIK